MEAFKAANPGSVLEDFIRWHSPKDWIESETDSQKGTLSERMADPKNIWVETWQMAQPVPVSKQKQIFDIRSEAEKALHYFETVNPKLVIKALMPTFALVIYDLFSKSPVCQELSSLKMLIQKLAKSITKVPWEDMYLSFI